MNFTFKKCWQNNDVGGILTTVSVVKQALLSLIVVHIGSKNEFLEGSGLIFRVRNSVNFEKWLEFIYIP
jgi:hypothetical protein